MFCDFSTRLGLCSKWVGSQKRCKKHLGMKVVNKISVPKFRGDSRYQREQGMFLNKGE